MWFVSYIKIYFYNSLMRWELRELINFIFSYYFFNSNKITITWCSTKQMIENYNYKFVLSQKILKGVLILTFGKKNIVSLKFHFKRLMFVTKEWNLELTVKIFAMLFNYIFWNARFIIMSLQFKSSSLSTCGKNSWIIIKWKLRNHEMNEIKKNVIKLLWIIIFFVLLCIVRFIIWNDIKIW